jgi:hypothetical protein
MAIGTDIHDMPTRTLRRLGWQQTEPLGNLHQQVVTREGVTWLQLLVLLDKPDRP